MLEWVAIPFSKGSSWPRDQILVSCIAGRFFTVWATRETTAERKSNNYWPASECQVIRQCLLFAHSLPFSSSFLAADFIQGSKRHPLPLSWHLEPPAAILVVALKDKRTYLALWRRGAIRPDLERQLVLCNREINLCHFKAIVTRFSLRWGTTESWYLMENTYFQLIINICWLELTFPASIKIIFLVSKF